MMHPSTLDVVGDSSIRLSPNTVTLSVMLSVVDPAYDVTLELLHHRTVQAKRALQKAGMARADLQTTAFRVSEEYDTNEYSEKPQVIGFRAGHKLTLSFPFSRERLGSVLRALADTDATITIWFSVAHQEQYYPALIREAYANAARIAHILADASAMQLGSPANVKADKYLFSSEAGQYESDRKDFITCAAMGEMPDPDIEPAETVLRCQLAVSWHLVPALS